MPGLEDASREELLALVVEPARMIEQLRAEVAELRGQGLRVIEVWDSPEHIERFMDSGLAQAMREAQIPEPTINEFEVHKLAWVRG